MSNFIQCDVRDCSSTARPSRQAVDPLPPGWRSVNLFEEIPSVPLTGDRIGEAAAVALVPQLAPFVEAMRDSAPQYAYRCYHMCPLHPLPEFVNGAPSIVDAEFAPPPPAPAAAPAWVAEVLKDNA